MTSAFGLSRHSSVPLLGGALLCVLLVPFGFILAGPEAHSQDTTPPYEVTVAAGDFDRRSTVVSFPLPVQLPERPFYLEAPTGNRVPLQTGKNRAWFVLDSLSAGAERTYLLKAGQQSSNRVRVERQKRALQFSVDDAPVLKYWVKPRPLPRPEIDSIFLRGGYLHPVRTPSGRVVTGDYPADHKHHHGIWSAWTKTEFRGRAPDFWNMGRGTGAVEPMALDTTWSGAVHGGLRARHRFVDYSAAEPVTALYEQWALRVYRATGSSLTYRMFDLTVTQTTASASPLILPEYHYGGVAVRGPDAWYGSENARFLTSGGKGQAKGNESRARWNYFGGSIDGKRAGILMLGHPENVRAPQPLRLGPGTEYFTFAPSQLGPWRIAPGRPYTARYRFITVDGPPDPAVFDRLWNDFAYPPTVTVQASPDGPNH